MLLSGWGRYPSQDVEYITPHTHEEFSRILARTGPVIARGLGRSYGDSSLAERVLGTRYLDHFLEFDDATGRLRCEAGVSLDDIVRCFAPRGWFPGVTPGTRFVTVGGAIASDVHGKNHHVDGSFSDHVESLEVLLGNGERIVASPSEHTDLFRATCSGMGLTGVILSATLRLRRISSSQIIETAFKVPNLESAVTALAECSGSAYSVAWIDCLARGKEIGRSIIMLGEHATDGRLTSFEQGPMAVPFDMPSGLLNAATVRAFNALYYHRYSRIRRTRLVPFETFFYPLDALANWNRLYGKRGFLQYQFVLPVEAGLVGLRTLLERIARAGTGSFLGVLKVFGKGNENHLSFPMEGYTLALDFLVTPRVLPFLHELDRVVADHGGRIYLSKDARMTEDTFRAGYPRWEAFQSIRAKYHALGKFSSAQSRRLGLG